MQRGRKRQRLEDGSSGSVAPATVSQLTRSLQGVDEKVRLRTLLHIACLANEGGDALQHVVDAKCVPAVVNCLHSPLIEIVSAAASAIAVIAEEPGAFAQLPATSLDDLTAAALYIECALGYVLGAQRPIPFPFDAIASIEVPAAPRPHRKMPAGAAALQNEEADAEDANPSSDDDANKPAADSATTTAAAASPGAPLPPGARATRARPAMTPNQERLLSGLAVEAAAAIWAAIAAVVEAGGVGALAAVGAADAPACVAVAAAAAARVVGLAAHVPTTAEASDVARRIDEGRLRLIGTDASVAAAVVKQRAVMGAGGGIVASPAGAVAASVSAMVADGAPGAGAVTATPSSGANGMGDDDGHNAAAAGGATSRAMERDYQSGAHEPLCDQAPRLSLSLRCAALRALQLLCEELADSAAAADIRARHALFDACLHYMERADTAVNPALLSGGRGADAAAAVGGTSVSMAATGGGSGILADGDIDGNGDSGPFGQRGVSALDESAGRDGQLSRKDAHNLAGISKVPMDVIRAASRDGSAYDDVDVVYAAEQRTALVVGVSACACMCAPPSEITVPLLASIGRILRPAFAKPLSPITAAVAHAVLSDTDAAHASPTAPSASFGESDGVHPGAAGAGTNEWGTDRIPTLGNVASSGALVGAADVLEVALESLAAAACGLQALIHAAMDTDTAAPADDDAAVFAASTVGRVLLDSDLPRVVLETAVALFAASPSPAVTVARCSRGYSVAAKATAALTSTILLVAPSGAPRRAKKGAPAAAPPRGSLPPALCARLFRALVAAVRAQVRPSDDAVVAHGTADAAMAPTLPKTPTAASAAATGSPGSATVAAAAAAAAAVATPTTPGAFPTFGTDAAPPSLGLSDPAATATAAAVTATAANGAVNGTAVASLPADAITRLTAYRESASLHLTTSATAPLPFDSGAVAAAANALYTLLRRSLVAIFASTGATADPAAPPAAPSGGPAAMVDGRGAAGAAGGDAADEGVAVGMAAAVALLDMATAAAADTADAARDASSITDGAADALADTTCVLAGAFGHALRAVAAHVEAQRRIAGAAARGAAAAGAGGANAAAQLETVIVGYDAVVRGAANALVELMSHPHPAVSVEAASVVMDVLCDDDYADVYVALYPLARIRAVRGLAREVVSAAKASKASAWTPAPAAAGVTEAAALLSPAAVLRRLEEPQAARLTTAAETVGANIDKFHQFHVSALQRAGKTVKE